jgi:hypothetical protein
VSEPIDDKALDEYLGRSSQISQRYRALVDDEHASVPPELDRLVLAQARNALAQQDAAKADELARLRTKRRRLTQWGVPAALAASAVLVISIVIRSGVQHEVRAVSERPVAAPAAAAPPASIAAAKQQSTETSAQNGVVLITPPPNAVTEFSPLAPSPAVPAEQRARQEQALAQSMAADAKSVRERIQSAPPPPMPQVSNEIPQAPEPSAAPSEIAPSAAVDASSAPPVIVPDSQQARYESNAAKRRSSEAEISEVAVTGVRRATVSGGSGPRNTIPQSAFDKAASDEIAREEQADAANVQAEPQRWLEHIRQLRKDGKSADADAEWKKFLERYPDYPVDQSDAARSKPQ